MKQTPYDITFIGGMRKVFYRTAKGHIDAHFIEKNEDLFDWDYEKRKPKFLEMADFYHGEIVEPGKARCTAFPDGSCFCWKNVLALNW